MAFKEFRPYFLFLFFVFLLLLGINFQEYAAVLEKAIKICLSCVGIG
jgi:hypothetical protein